MEKKKLEKYQNVFENWRDSLLATGKDEFTIESRVQRDTKKALQMTISREELMSVVQCSTSNVNEPYYVARQGFPEYWFISRRGTLLSVYNKTVVFVIPSVSGGNREQYEISCQRNGVRGEYDGLEIDPAVIVGLCFGAESTLEAKEMLDKYGLYATKTVNGRKAVDIHHIKGYNREGSPSEMRAYNCSLGRIRFETKEVHNIHSFAHMTIEEKRIFEQMKVLQKQNVNFRDN